MQKKLIFTIGIITTLTIIASAQTTNQTAIPADQGKCHGVAWFGIDNNGVCDNFKKEPRMGQGKGQGHGNGHGKGRGHGHGEGQGQGKGQGKGKGKGQGQGQGQGRGAGFAETNDDGTRGNRTAQASEENA